ncbi:hypothetical protein [Acidovorax facilis]|uniref:hypothetical protein n=1 Tax=Acidovorax facilis TaxID=12917 RepID=UPI003D65826B
MKKLITTISLAVAVVATSLPSFGGQKLKIETPPDVAVDDAWINKVEQLEKLLSNSAVGKVSDIRLLSTLDTPIKGLKAVVYEAMIENPANGQRKPERLVLYSDTSGRYAVVGSVVDMKEGKDLGSTFMREQAGNTMSPALLEKAELAPGTGSRRIVLVLDLGQPQGRQFLSELLQRYTAAKSKAGVDMALVSDAQKEINVGAQAVLMGAAGTTRMLPWLAEWLRDGEKASFVDKNRLRNDAVVKATLGKGVFAIDKNSRMAVESGIDRLPLIFVNDKGRYSTFKPPQSEADWKALLGQ